MVAYNFMAQFADDVAEGRKNNTIRADRKRHAKVGEPVQLYSGMRSKACRKLRDPDPVCTESKNITIGMYGVTLAGLDVGDLTAFARRDGFPDFIKMRTFFAETHGLPFHGVFIAWEPLKKADWPSAAFGGSEALPSEALK